MNDNQRMLFHYAILGVLTKNGDSTLGSISKHLHISCKILFEVICADHCKTFQYPACGGPLRDLKVMLRTDVALGSIKQMDIGLEDTSVPAFIEDLS